jgi:hypothetical protein
MHFDDIAKRWLPTLDKTMKFGSRNVSKLNVIHQELEFVDQVMFQWSAGTYFYPEVVHDHII